MLILYYKGVIYTFSPPVSHNNFRYACTAKARRKNMLYIYLGIKQYATFAKKSHYIEVAQMFETM